MYWWRAAHRCLMIQDFHATWQHSVFCYTSKDKHIIWFMKQKPKGNGQDNKKIHYEQYLLTYSIEQSPSWEANRFATSQEIPRILCNPKVHYRIHKCPPPVSILSQFNPHTTSWRSILILSSHLRLGLRTSPFPSGFPTKTLYTPLPSPTTRPVPTISIFSILSPTQFWVRSTDHNMNMNLNYNADQKNASTWILYWF
jgi:hypothetical protein